MIFKYLSSCCRQFAVALVSTPFLLSSGQWQSVWLIIDTLTYSHANYSIISFSHISIMCLLFKLSLLNFLTFFKILIYSQKFIFIDVDINILICIFNNAWNTSNFYVLQSTTIDNRQWCAGSKTINNIFT